MKNALFLVLALLVTSHSYASATRDVQADTIHATGGSSLTVPSTGSSVLSNLSALPAASVTGQVAVANGGTGAATLTSNGVLQGNGTSAVTAVTGSQYQVVQYGSGGVPAAGAVNLGQAAAVTGQLTLANGGTGSPGAAYTSNGVVYDNGGVLGSTAAGLQYQVVTVNGSNQPFMGALQLNQGGLAVTGTLNKVNGGTGTTAFLTNGVVYDNGTGLTNTSAGSQYQVYQAGSGGIPTVGALNLGQSAAVTGQLVVANGGSGAATLTQNGVLMGNGTGAITAIGPSASTGFVLTSNGSGSAPSFQAVTSSAPSLNGGSASPQTVTAVGGVVLSSIATGNFAWVTSSGAVTVTKTPSVTVGTSDAQVLRIIGTSNTNTITLQDQSALASSGLSLNGNITLAKDSVLMLHWDAAQSLWVEDSRR